MTFLLIGCLLIFVELAYLSLAKKIKIYDSPNGRSSHSKPTIRGGGIVFPIAMMFYSVHFKIFEAWILGLLLISIVSFIDDIYTLSNKIRILIHFAGVSFLLVNLNVYSVWGLGLIVLLFIAIIGTINAWNFMDGINGITVLYTMSVLIALFYFNTLYSFSDPRLLWIIAIATAIFGFFNFRKKAVCFAGDVGSVSISFILIYLILSLIIFTGNLIFMLLVSVYGVDSIMTIIYRLSKKENIFQAHRSHLYQLMANERKMPHLVVSGIYFIAQIIVNFVLIAIVGFSSSLQYLIGIGIIILLSGIYWVVRHSLVRKLSVAP